jgi:hypothetical protein
VPTLEITKDFRWNTGTPTLFYYTVVGECLSSACTTTGLDPSDHRCSTGKQSFLKILAARNVAEVCQALSDDRYPKIWPIKSIKRHSRPVYSDDQISSVDYSCQLLVEEDFQSVPECAEIALAMQTHINIGGTTSLHNFVFHGSDEVTINGVGISLGGSSDVSITADSLEYVASGAITVTPEVEIGGNLALAANSGAGTEITLFELELEEERERLVPFVSTVGPITRCGCEVFPIIYLRHNLVNNNSLRNFLSINDLSLPSEIALSFNNEAWRKNFQFTGLGETGSHERWMALFEWGCTSFVDGIDLSENRWFFSLFVSRKNLVTTDDFETRLLYFFPPNAACSNNVLSFSFVVDTQSRGTIISRSPTVEDVFHDEVGLFTSQHWVKNRFFRVSIQENLSVVDKRLDISPIFTT